MADWQDLPQPRALPPVQRLLQIADAREGAPAAPSRAAWTHALRAELASVRRLILAGDAAPIPSDQEIVARARAAMRHAGQPALRRVLNATGIVVHTNLGRAPLAPEAVAAVVQAAGDGCNLEFDLETGRRGARAGAVETLLCGLTGAAAGIAVNNNAAALLLALSGLAGDAEVIVSRGELVEIGGGFRIPDIIQQGGARLVEVGSTNRTRLADYEAAITPRTRMLLKVHQSNFAMIGFTEATPLHELSGLARRHGLVLLDDLGSGILARLPGLTGLDEPTVGESIEAGSDVVAFSGDKLLGGPQAGLLVGSAACIDRMRRHPLLRALRLDKMTLAALEATLRLHTDAQGARRRIPVLRMLGQTVCELQGRAEALLALLDAGDAHLADARRVDAHIEASIGHAGGGALPAQDLASRAVSVAVADLSAEALARRLRTHRPAVVGRIQGGRLLLDMLTVGDADLADIAHALRDAAV